MIERGHNFGPGNPKPASRGERRILVVEDDLHLLSSLHLGLRHLGFRVFAAGNAAEAEEIWALTGGAIDALLCDHVLGYDRGTDLVRRFKLDHPNLQAVLCSGATEPAEARGMPFLQKPFELAALSDLLS